MHVMFRTDEVESVQICPCVCPSLLCWHCSITGNGSFGGSVLKIIEINLKVERDTFY